MTGSRNTRSATKWLHETLLTRGYDTCSIVLSDPPRMRYDGFEFPVTPTARGITTAIRRAAPVEVLVVENTGTDDYVMRVINNELVRPHRVLVLNIRPDHSVFGGWRATAKAVAQSITPSSDVITGVQHPVGRKILNNELTRRDITVSHAALPAQYWSMPDSESVFVIDSFLRSFDADGLGDKVESYLNQIRPRWTVVAGTRVYVADTVTDPVSLERLRGWLCHGTMPFQPVIVADRSHDARIAAFVRYLNDLATQDLITSAYFVGPNLGSAIRSTDFEVILREQSTATEVFDDATSHGTPMIAVGTDQSQFMTDLNAVVRRRTAYERQAFRPAAPRAATIELHTTSDDRFRTESLEYASLGGMNVLIIDPTGSADRWIDGRKAVGHRHKMGIISVGNDPRPRRSNDRVTVEVLENPVDPEEVMMLTEIYLDEWRAPTLVCVSAVGSLCETLGQPTGFEVIRLLAEHVREDEGTAHFHVDPAAVDDRSIRRIQRAVTTPRRPSPVITN